MDDTVILVVGTDPYKKKIVNILQKSRYGNLVKDTTNLPVGYRDIIRVDPLRQWISLNALRRTNGLALKFVHAFGKKKFFGKFELVTEVELVRVLFEKCEKYVLLVAEQNFPSKVATAYSARMHLEGLRDEDWIPQLESQIERLEHIDVKRIIDVGPVWQSEKVILFGRTGSGKSTIAQMLLRGELLSESEFEIGSSARGVTSRIMRNEGRGWHVTDTPGFGESKEGTVPTADAEEILENFIFAICGMYSHFVYVLKYDRLNVYDEKLWKFFRTIFRGAESNFSVVITNCKNELSESDEARVKKVFSGCSRFIPVDFCPRVVGDDELEEENIVDRKLHLEVLEDRLAGAGLYDIDCDKGKISLESLRYTKRQYSGSFLGPVQESVYNWILSMRRLPTSETSENFVLLPQYIGR